MPARKIRENVFAVGANDWHRKFFDAFIPLPHGTSYNAYLVRGSEKTALIDTVEPEKWDELKSNLEELHLERLDYIISNHAEQDHSGSIPEVLKMFPEAKVVTNAKCKGILMDLLDMSEEAFLEIKDKETLSLGDKNLQFLLAPWVHWPETMFTFLQEDRILFSCDLFGSHLATSDLFARDERLVYQEAKRYYAQIMMPYAKNVVKYIQTIDTLNVEMIATSHGPVYDQPDFILDAYRDWSSEETKNCVAVFYISMHGSTEKMANYLVEALMKRDISVKPYNLLQANQGEIAISLVDATTLVFASPAFLVGPHPNALCAAHLVNFLKPKAKYVGIIGSYGWGNKLVDQLTGFLPALKVEVIPPVLAKGVPKAETYRELDNLAEEIAKRHREMFG